jgi:hypothetical protein
VALAAVAYTGLYNPRTPAGDSVVNGILESAYTTAVAPSVAHVLLAPLLAAFRMAGLSTAALESGGQSESYLRIHWKC